MGRMTLTNSDFYGVGAGLGDEVRVAEGGIVSNTIKTSSDLSSPRRSLAKNSNCCPSFKRRISCRSSDCFLSSSSFSLCRFLWSALRRMTSSSPFFPKSPKKPKRETIRTAPNKIDFLKVLPIGVERFPVRRGVEELGIRRADNKKFQE